MIIILVFIGIGVYLLVGYLRDRSRDCYKDATNWLAGSIFWWGIGSGILLIVLAIINTNVSRMRAFQSTNKKNLKILVEETRRLSNIPTNTTLGLEKFKLCEEVARRLAELTQQVNKYNGDLSVYKMYKSSPLTSWLIPSLDGLDYIRLKKFDE